MALLDFVKNRQSEQQSAGQSSEQAKPETAREMYSRQAEAEKSNAKPLDRIAPDQRARVDSVKADLDKATQYAGQSSPRPSTEIPTEGAASPQPMAQKMMQQDKAAPALSPTSAQAGARASEKESPALSGDASAKSQERSQSQRQTVARRPPSWER